MTRTRAVFGAPGERLWEWLDVRGGPTGSPSLGVSAPFAELAVHFVFWAGCGPAWVVGCPQLEIKLATAVLDQLGWDRHLPRVFRVVREVIVPFYDEQGRVSGGPTPYVENPSPITARSWYVALAVVHHALREKRLGTKPFSGRVEDM